jgi:putative transposase
MDHIQNHLQKMNDNQTNSYHKRLEKEKLKPMDQQKEINLNLFDFPTKEKSFVGYNFLDCLFKTMKQKDYYSLPGQKNQQVLKNVVQNWKSFFESLKDYKMHPEKYSGRPSIPGYLPKGGLKETILSNQICTIKEGKYLKFPKTNLKLNIGKLASKAFNSKSYRNMMVYSKWSFDRRKIRSNSQKERCMGIDLGRKYGHSSIKHRYDSILLREES